MMHPSRRPHVLIFPTASVASAAIAVVFGIAALGLVGWILDIPALKSFIPGLAPIRVTTAIALLISAVATFFITETEPAEWKRRFSFVSCAFTGAFGLLTVTGYLFEYLTGQSWPHTDNPVLHYIQDPAARIPVVTAALFFLYACVVALMGSRNRRFADVGHALLLTVSTVSYLILLGYLFDIRELYVRRGVAVAFNTSIAFPGLCIASFCIRPRTWFMSVFTSEGAGADMARRLLPFTLILPLVIGWFRLHGERYGFFGSEAGVALVAVTYTVCFLLILWMNARAVNRTDLLRSKAERAGNESGEMLKRAQEIAHLGSWELDIVNNRLSWSDEVYRIFGYEPQSFEATYEAFLACVHPDDRAAVDTAYHDSVRDGNDSYEIEHRIVRESTGEVRIVHEKCEHIRDDAGKIIRSAGMVHDLTERRGIEDAILRAKQEWERTFDSVPDLIAIMDSDHRIKQVNKAMAERLGRTPAACNGLNCYREIHGTDKPPDDCPHSLMLTDGREHITEINEQSLNGAFLVSTTPIFDTEDRMTGSVHVARDITELKKKEQELHRLNRTLKALSDSGHIMSLLLGEQEYLNEICKIIVEDCGHRMVWIGFTGEDAEKIIRPAAFAGFEYGFLTAVKMTWTGMNDRCPVGRALQSAAPALCGNIRAEDSPTPWREEALKRGYASCIAFPLLSGKRAFGVIAIYSSEIDPFLPDEVKLLGDLTADLANGIEMIRLQVARTKTEELLQEERKFIDAIVQTTGGLIIGLDPAGRIRSFNNACEKTTGYAFNEVKDRPFWDIFTVPDEIESVKTVFGNLTRGSFPNEFENYWLTRSGNRRFIRWTNSAVLGDGGSVEMVIGTGIDITERKEAEEALIKTKNELELRVRERTADLRTTLDTLEKERQRFNDVLEMLPAYVVLLTKDHYIPFANRCFKQWFGEPGNKRCYEFLFGRNEPCVNCETFKPFTTRAPHHWEWTGPNGRNYDIYDFPFTDVDGAPLVLEMGIDISDRKKAEAALMEANEMKVLGQLTSGVAHEVRNPLNGILAIMGALSRELADDNRFEPYMQHMRNQVTRLTVLMEDLLVLGRPLREENLNEISMVTLVEKTVATWLQTQQVSDPSIRIIAPDDRDGYPVRVDVTSMTQVLINLIENAHNHSSKGTEIVCSVEERIPGEILFSIKDRGTGIPEDILPKIFDPFFTTRKGGTGLGLSIVRRIVDNHGGCVTAFNNSDGPGATFEVSLPRIIACVNQPSPREPGISAMPHLL